MDNGIRHKTGVNEVSGVGAGLGIDILFQSQREGHPRVTVAVSLYNYRRYIGVCLDSVQAQTLSDIDLIIVDDGSKDGSEGEALGWLERHASRFNRALLVQHKVNRGLADARNTAFTLARTSYVFVLDADNLLYPRCLERLASALDHCQASFAYCYLEKFGEVSALQNTQPWEPRLFQYGNTIDAMALIRRNVWEKVGGYSKMEVMGWEDFDFWFKIARIGGWGVQVPEVLARYRVHHTSMLHTVANPKADRLWRVLYTSYPEFFTDALVVGALFTRLQDWVKAAQAYERAVNQPRAGVEAWEGLCQAYLRQSNQAEFEGALMRYLERYPERAPHVVENYPKELTSLERVFERLAEQCFSHPAILKAQAQVLFRRGKVEAARTVATAARRSQENRRQHLHRLIDQGQWQEAEALLSTWLTEDKEDFDALCMKARLLLAQGAWVEGLRLYERLLPLGRERLDFLTEYLEGCLRLGNRKTALKIVEHLLLLPHSEEWGHRVNDLANRWPDFLPLQALAFTPLPTAPYDSPPGEGKSGRNERSGMPLESARSAAQLLETLLEADDILAALEVHRHQLTPEVLHLVWANTQAARRDGDLELAEGLEALGMFIQEALAG